MKEESSDSKYNGTYWPLLGRVVLSILISVASVGIAVPWAIAMVYRWIMKQVTIGGKQVGFRGVGKQLFPAWIVAWIVAIAGVATIVLSALITFDKSVWYEAGGFTARAVPPIFVLLVVLIGAIVLAVCALTHLRITRILIANTHFDGVEGKTSSFASSYWQYIGKHIVYTLRLIITAGVALPWALDYLLTWFLGETKIDDTQLSYSAKPSFLKKWLPYWAILWVVWILQELTDRGDSYHGGRGGALEAINGLLELSELFIQVLVYTVIFRFIFARISNKELAEQ